MKINNRIDFLQPHKHNIRKSKNLKCIKYIEKVVRIYSIILANKKNIFTSTTEEVEEEKRGCWNDQRGMPGFLVMFIFIVWLV